LILKIYEAKRRKYRFHNKPFQQKTTNMKGRKNAQFAGAQSFINGKRAKDLQSMNAQPMTACHGLLEEQKREGRLGCLQLSRQDMKGGNE